MNIDEPRIEHLPALKNIWHNAFNDTEEFVNDFFTTAFAPHRCRIVTCKGEITAALYWFDCLYRDKPVAYLYAIATAKSYRRQGICHRLISDTHHHLTALGYDGSILVPGSKELFKLYESLGYQTCSHIQEFCCTGMANSIPINNIGKNEYAKLRRRFLPQGGVVQERENMDFLQTQATFYTGPGYLLAVRKESDTLHGIELLGDTHIAPGLVHMLRCKKGIFRTPGENIPFAMYHPLGKGTPIPPSYFGFAFD